jgi:hypothetical protein
MRLPSQNADGFTVTVLHIVGIDRTHKNMSQEEKTREVPSGEQYPRHTPGLYPHLASSNPSRGGLGQLQPKLPPFNKAISLV